MGETFEALIFNQLSEIPGPGGETETNRIARAPGGGVIITAVAVARLGLDPCVVSALSPLTRKALVRDGIAYRNLLRADEEPALTVSLSTTKERRSVAYRGINDDLEDRLLQETVPGKVRARHVYGAFFPEDCQKWLEPLSLIRNEDVGLSWDFGWNQNFQADGAFLELLELLDVVFLSEPEAHLYSGKETLEEALAFWREHAMHTVIRRTTEGCLWVGREGEGSSPGEDVELPETAGADAAFNGGYLYARISGMDPQESAKVATRVSTITARRPGSIDEIPYREELE
jgi:sugar/nucleoside kinase (ribokinase family)